MMSNNDKSKKEGEHILNNYKKQLAEKMARDKANKGDMSVKSSAKGSSRTANMMMGGGMDKRYNKKDKSDEDFGNRFAAGGDIGGNEPPEPEVLLSILHRKTKN